MRILLAPHGTRGDVQPMLALAAAARARGHDVRFVAPDNFVPWIARHGFACEPDGIDIEAVLRHPGTDLQALRWQHEHLVSTIIPRLFDSVGRAARGAELIVGSGVQIAGGSIAELCRVPYISTVFCPCAIPSRTAPPPWVRPQWLPGWINRLLWRSGGRVADRVIRGPLDRARAAIGLDAVRDVMAVMSGDATLLAADRELGPRPLDAPDRVRATDAWMLDGPALDREPPETDSRTEAFLRAGPPPVYVGFGSMIAQQVHDLPERIIEAGRRAGVRLLVAGGWAALDRELSGAVEVLAVPHLDHRTVLPRVAAAVHHGGAGTTTAAARAGVPQVIAPHILDQRYWAHRVQVLGVGPAPLPIERLTAEALARRIVAALRDGRMRDRARALGARVAARNGVAEGVLELERVAHDCRR